MKKKWSMLAVMAAFGYVNSVGVASYETPYGVVDYGYIFPQGTALGVGSVANGEGAVATGRGSIAVGLYALATGSNESRQTIESKMYENQQTMSELGRYESTTGKY